MIKTHTLQTLSASSSGKSDSSEMTYFSWKLRVDRICRKELGLGLFDLEDLPTRDAYDDGLSPAKFYREYVIPLLEDEYGF